MRAVPILIGAIALLVLPLIILAVVYAVDDGDFDVNATGPSIDSGARIEIERLRQQMEALEGQVTQLKEQLQQVASRPVGGAVQPGAGVVPQAQDNGFVADGENAIVDAYAQVVLIANRRQVNKGINVAGSRWLEQFLGRPRENLSDKCESMTNPKLKSMLVVESVGPIRVSMLQPAVDSITRVFEKVKATDPDLYARINTAGSLCVRQIRGTRGRTSTHSFGLAVDLNIDGKLDTLGDGKTQLGLTILADFFNEEGWAWGAAWGREDSMHFEVSKQMLQQWRKEGKI
ncbi:MAG: M15 family metallopeptidase [Sulfitobacter sp.]